MHVHIFFFLSRSGTLFGCASYVAQVYTRDATHRPTATWTPGRGADSELGVFGKFREISEKSRKNLTWRGFQLSFFGFFGVPGGSKTSKFHEISRFFHFFDPPPGPPRKPRKTPFFTAQPRRNPRELSQNRAKTGGRGGGRFATFGNLNRWSLDQLLYGPRFRSS